MKKRTRTIFLALIGVFAVLQLFQIDKTNPPSDPADDFIAMENPPEQVALLMKNACYDCHSNHTKYPWYTSIQPVAWWIRGHYRHGRKKLNFSKWSGYDSEKKEHKIEECIDEVEAKHMPLKSYTWMHPEAKLSEEDRKVLIDYFRSKSY